MPIRSEPAEKKPIQSRKRIQHIAEYILVRLFGGILSLLPRPRALRAGRWIGRLFHSVLIPRNKIAQKNILASLPETSPAEADTIVRKCWENLGAGAAEFVKMSGMSKEEIAAHVELHGIEQIRQSAAAGRGGRTVPGRA